MTSKVRKILLPLFPENEWLRKHWWHKLVKLVAVIVSISSLYTILWIITLFYFLPRSWMDSPFYPPLYHLSYLVAYLPMNFTSFLSRFPIYGNAFDSLLPVPIIGPIALILILTSVLYIAPSLLYRLTIYIYRRFYMKRVKIIFFAILLGLGLFFFSTWKLQQLINDGSIIADEECLKVNPLIIARKNSYINSIKIMLASGSAEEYWAETNKYLDFSKKYIAAQESWLKKQKAHTDRWDFQIFMPSYVKEAGKIQYVSREADTKAQSAMVELLETYKNIDAEKQKTLSETIINEIKKNNDADDEFNRMWDLPKKFDFKTQFTKVPPSKCPDENFNIPDVKEFLNPKTIPTDYNQPLS